MRGHGQGRPLGKRTFETRPACLADIWEKSPQMAGTASTKALGQEGVGLFKNQQGRSWGWGRVEGVGSERRCGYITAGHRPWKASALNLSETDYTGGPCTAEGDDLTWVLLLHRKQTMGAKGRSRDPREGLLPESRGGVPGHRPGQTYGAWSAGAGF